MRLLKSRIVMLGAEIDDEVANEVVAQLLFLESEGDAGVSLYVSSPGGSVTASLAIIDAMRALKPAVGTVCIGRAAGTAALVLACGARGQRLARRNAIVQLVPLTGAAERLEQHRELERLTETVVRLYVEATGQSYLQLVTDLDRGRAFSAEEAVAYGFVDAVAEGR